MSRNLIKILIGGIFLFVSGCSSPQTKNEKKKEERPLVTNRINISNDIITNLGITFQKVSFGKLGKWVPIPGKLQIPRENRYTLWSPVKGRIYWEKNRLEWINKWDVVAIIETPVLSQIQQEITAALQNFKTAKFLDKNNQNSQLRLLQLEKKYSENLSKLGLITGNTPEELEKEIDGKPLWANIKRLEIKAPGNGYLFEVDVASGEIVEEGKQLGIILDATKLVFRGLAPTDTQIPPQAAVQINMANRVVDTTIKGPIPIADKESAKLWVEAAIPNDDKNLIDEALVIANIEIEKSEFEEAIVPESCVLLDQLQAFVFKRDAKDPNMVIRTPVVIGKRSGNRLELLSGVLEGDEIVCHGIHQLKLLGSTTPTAKGHFHADGTWHEGDE